MRRVLRHIVFFQHGDFGQAWRRFAEGLPETYRDQRRSVDFVAGLAPENNVTIVAVCDREHHETLAPGLVSVGISQQTAYAPRRLIALMSRLGPDVLVVRAPNEWLLLWARLRGLPSLACFADTFRQGGLRDRLRLAMLRWGLGGGNLACVANHSRNASLSVERVLRIAPGRILPWDHPPLPAHPDPKPAGPAPGQLRLFYAGPLAEPKGVGDALRAMAALDQAGIRAEADFAGAGDLAAWEAQARALGLEGRARFPGRLPHAEVQARMRAADAVLVPSRHDYAEGLPNTLCEALAARGVLVMSDHPAFAGRLRDGEDCLIFRAADPADLARVLTRLAGDPALARHLSQGADRALEKLYYGILWIDLIRLFLEDPANRTGWVARNSLARMRQDDRRDTNPRDAALSGETP